ncbi:DUF4407 domain-containing protein [Parapedobacter koreensis]|uniref:DUF4407 domain-containing protein n=1 Tax=Parapedobacter koreensis TaxID=332977 RepID=A0A1H7QU53_9SPHI|nr:DUF4407 domain-containing protein [Parapedobacter koreensis]SEL51254.1 protein of unknown function [Parapedobacter koreensis]
MEKLTRFFWWCSGTHQATLAKYPAEHNKYVGIGATIFFTGLFAALSGGYALYFVFSGGSFAPLYAILFGLLWGLAIFNMDRYIVLSINKNASGLKQLFQATPRILLAVLIGIVIARPLELKVFDKEIREQLRVTYLDRQRANIDTLNKAFESKYAIELGRVTELKTERDSLEAAIKSDRVKLKMETFGEKTVETSGIVGYGPYAKQRQAELDKQEQYLDTLRSRIQLQETFIQQRKQFEGLLDERLLTGAQLDSAVNVAGFADRNAALGDLKYHPDGTLNEANYWSITFIMLLFIFFECLPVFVKLMSVRDAYDIALRDQQTVDIHRSGKNRDAEIAITDSLYDTHVQQAIEKRKARVWEDETL